MTASDKVYLDGARPIDVFANESTEDFVLLLKSIEAERAFPASRIGSVRQTYETSELLCKGSAASCALSSQNAHSNNWEAAIDLCVA